MTINQKLFAVVCSLIAVAGCEAPRPQLDLPPAIPQVTRTKTASQIEPIPPMPKAKPPVKAPKPEPLVQSLPAGRSVRNRTITATAIGNGSQCVLVIGGIHGNEPAGVGLCTQLIAYLSAHDELLYGLKVIIVPAANPDGLAASTRGNANGVDINRNFATSNYRASAVHGGKAMSQPEAKYLRGIIDRYRPARILTIHQPLSCVDYDGPARSLAAAVSRASGLPVKKLGARPGSLGSYAGVENNIPTVTVELPRGATNLTARLLWQRYGGAMLAGVRHSNHATTLGDVGK